MAVWMQPIEVPGPKKAAEPHSTTETWNCVCDMCPALSCIRQPKRTEPWRYWCEDLHAQVDPRTMTKDECPRGREAARGRKGSR